MDAAGISGLWAVMVFNLVSFVLIAPIFLIRRHNTLPVRPRLHITTCFCGLAYVLYIGAFLYTEVIRVLVLFYLMPVWGFVLARIFVGEAISPVRWLCMLLGLSGLVVICGIEQGIPLPSNMGDWMALISGVGWAGASLSILTDRKEPVNYSIAFLFWGALWSIVLATLATTQGILPTPSWSHLTDVLIWMVPLAIFIVIPGAFATMYAPSQLNPGIVGLLFMTEISIATTTAALFASEPFGPKEITGVVLITLAGIIEPLILIFFKTRKSTPVTPRFDQD